MSEGICNKCGQHGDLVLADRGCVSCRDALDKQSANSTATDWVLLVSGLYAVRVHIYLSTPYEEVRRIWAEWPVQFPGRLLEVRPTATSELADLEAYWGTWHNRTDARFIRPATEGETAAAHEPRQHLVTPKPALSGKSIAETIGMKKLKSGLVQLFWATVSVVMLWWLTPDWKIKYTLWYNVSSDRVNIEIRPTECDWGRAPLGYKACYYEKIVSTVQWATSRTGNPIISYDEGKTWSVFSPDAGVTVPKSPRVQNVNVSWQKKDDP